MAFSIVDLNRSTNDDPTFYEDRFQHLLEVHLPILRQHPSATSEKIPPDMVYQFEGDFYGYLYELGVPPHLYWLYMRMNRLKASWDFGKEQYDVYRRESDWFLQRPPMEYVQSLKKRYLTDLL